MSPGHSLRSLQCAEFHRIGFISPAGRCSCPSEVFLPGATVNTALGGSEPINTNILCLLGVACYPNVQSCGRSSQVLRGSERCAVETHYFWQKLLVVASSRTDPVRTTAEFTLLQKNLLHRRYNPSSVSLCCRHSYVLELEVDDRRFLLVFRTIAVRCSLRHFFSLLYSFALEWKLSLQ